MFIPRLVLYITTDLTKKKNSSVAGFCLALQPHSKSCHPSVSYLATCQRWLLTFMKDYRLANKYPLQATIRYGKLLL